MNFKEICIIGYYGFGNIGDDAILVAALEEYINAYNIYVRILVNDNSYIEKMLRRFNLDRNVALYNRWSLKQVSEAIHYSEALVFCGGGLFQDKTSIRSFLYYFSLALMAKLKRKKIIIERNSIGPLNTKISRFLFHKVLEWVDYVSVRDRNSLDFLNQNYPQFAGKYLLKEDFVISPISSSIFKNTINVEEKYDLLFIIRKFPKVRNIISLIKELEKVYRVKVMVFQQKDLEDFSDIFDVEYPGDGEIYNALSIIQSSKLIISNRLHGIIFALLRDKKVIGISIDPKIEGFCKDNNIDYVCEDDEDIESKVMLLVEKNLR